MKNKMTGPKAFLPLMIVLSVAGFQSTAQAQAASVGLQVNSNQTQLEATTRGNCSQNNTNGCVRANGVMQINFNLAQASCASGGNWALSEVYLGNSKNNWGNISTVAASDFNANASSGVVTPVSQSPNHIGIRNNNSQAYEIWYTVTATCGSSTIELDPRIINDGSGRPG
jgi:hypothetical protein